MKVPLIQLTSRLCCLVLVLIVAVVSGVGCTSVEPWQRQTFNRASMQTDSDPLTDMLTEHLYFSREAASGGESVGGGGCGCN